MVSRNGFVTEFLALERLHFYCPNLVLDLVSPQ